MPLSGPFRVLSLVSRLATHPVLALTGSCYDPALLRASLWQKLDSTWDCPVRERLGNIDRNEINNSSSAGATLSQ